MSLFLVSVLAGVVACAIWAAIVYMRHETNREDAAQKIKERTCRHEWRSLDERNEPGSGLVFISPDAYECVKCGARK